MSLRVPRYLDLPEFAKKLDTVRSFTSRGRAELA